jgi:hypothetical protein
MKITILGWGSLVWQSKGIWQSLDGNQMDKFTYKFARISNDVRLTS